MFEYVGLSWVPCSERRIVARMSTVGEERRRHGGMIDHGDDARAGAGVVNLSSCLFSVVRFMIEHAISRLVVVVMTERRHCTRRTN